jgi:hypothetical protein
VNVCEYVQVASSPVMERDEIHETPPGPLDSSLANSDEIHETPPGSWPRRPLDSSMANSGASEGGTPEPDFVLDTPNPGYMAPAVFYKGTKGNGRGKRQAK